LPYEQITGVEKDRLVFGDILDAYGTELFGKKVTRSDQAREKLQKLADLNVKSTFSALSDGEFEEQLELRKIFNSDVATES
jgi:hypothetical protein